MTRPLPIAIGVAAIAVVLLSACGTSSAPELTDPTAIVSAALASTDAAKTVHVDATIDGDVPISLPGIGGGGPVDLTGTTATADLDLAGSAAHATFLVPALFNLSGDLIATGGQGYIKTTLTGDQYQTVDLSTLPIDLSDAHGLIDKLGAPLQSGQVALKKGNDVACGAGQCYSITADLTGEQLAAMFPGTTLPIDLSSANGTIEITVEKSAPNHIHGVRIEVTQTAGGNPTVIGLTFSDWDKPVTISAPPPDQVQGA